jgi:hypothetical protein
MITLRGVRCAGHVPCIWERRGWWGNLKAKEHVQDLDVGGRFMLQQMLKN